MASYIQTTARADNLNGRLALSNLHDVYAHSLIGSVQDPYVSPSIFLFLPPTPFFRLSRTKLKLSRTKLKLSRTKLKLLANQTQTLANQTQTPAPTPMPLSRTHLFIRSLGLTAPWCARSQAFKGVTFRLSPVSTRPWRQGRIPLADIYRRK